jgi:hypothetical protein
MIVSLDALAENGRAQLMILDKTLKQLRAQLAASKVIQKKAGRPASRAAKAGRLRRRAPQPASVADEQADAALEDASSQQDGSSEMMGADDEDEDASSDGEDDSLEPQLREMLRQMMAGG